MKGLLKQVRLFFMGAGLPVFLASATLVYVGFLLVVVFWPTGDGGLWAGFVAEFKIWCFDYDPRTGGMEWMAFWIMLAEPLFITGMVLTLWITATTGQGGRTDLQRFNLLGHWRAGATGTVLAMLAVGGIYTYGQVGADSEVLPPFPGERIRTQLEPPDFLLEDHREQPVRLDTLKGKAVLITGIYAMCSTSCPDILREIGEVVESLPEDIREHLAIVAFSLNPEYDTRDLMNRIAEGYGFTYPEFRYLNGDPGVMRPLLRKFQFAPILNERTGLIDHANLFILLDPQGRIAYRFNLDPRHRPWLRAALLSLLVEAGSTAQSLQ